MLRLAFALLLCAAALGAVDPPLLPVAPIAPPAAANAIAPSLTTGPDGTAWLTWLERGGAETLLRFAVLQAGEWSKPGTIARGRDWFVNTADFPALTVGRRGQATAVWFVNNPPANAHASISHHGSSYHARISSTKDGGVSWSAPVALTQESEAVEFVSIATLADGRVLAAWLDGRARHRGAHAQQLYARIVGERGADMLIDAQVCDCCQTALTTFPDGTALLAYRGRTTDEIRDVLHTRFRDGQWEAPQRVHADNWRISGCPVNGPQLATQGGRAAIAWFTAAADEPRVFAALSFDAGARFIQPLQLDVAKPSGRVATTLLRDGAILVTWVDTEGTLWLGRVAPDYTTTRPQRVTDARDGRVRGFPRVALLRDYHGGESTAELLIVFSTDAPARLHTLRVTIPEGELLRTGNDCDCAPSAEQLAGFPIRGKIVGVGPGVHAVRVEHAEIPGVLRAGVHEFQLSPQLATHRTSIGREFLGRIEQGDDTWHLLNVRLITTAPSP